MLQWGRVLWDAERSNTSCRVAPPGRSFNGAASCGTRKVRRVSASAAHNSRFNGAASCGTRKADPHYWVLRLLVWLQWGRVLWDAESPSGCCPCPREHRLQWGRVLWDAERPLVDSVGTLGSSSFNGAASCGTRKEVQQIREAHDAVASMGPRLVGRGKVSTFIRAACCPSASMGPRLVGRGKNVFSLFATITLMLQWGRVLWDAESPLFIRFYVRAHFRFNGAASCGTRKVYHLEYTLHLQAASMGPRLVGRGKQQVLTKPMLPGSCFNGAASCGTRKEPKEF